MPTDIGDGVAISDDEGSDEEGNRNPLDSKKKDCDIIEEEAGKLWPI